MRSMGIYFKKCLKKLNIMKVHTGKNFDVEVAHDNKYISTLNSYKNKIRTNFYDKGLPPETISYTSH